MAAKQECVKEMDNGIILAGLATRRLWSAPLNAFPHSSPRGLNKTTPANKFTYTALSLIRIRTVAAGLSQTR